MKRGPAPLSAAEHHRRGNYRRDCDRDAALEHAVVPTSRAEALQGLPPVAEQMAAAVLNAYAEDFDASALFTLRCYALSCQRLATLLAARTPNTHALYEESLLNLELRRALRLEGAEGTDDAP